MEKLSEFQEQVRHVLLPYGQLVEQLVKKNVLDLVRIDSNPFNLLCFIKLFFYLLS